MAWLMCEKMVDNQTAIVDLVDSQAYVIIDPDGPGEGYTIKVFKNDAVWGIIGKTSTFHEAETLIASLIHFCDDEEGNVHIIEFADLLETVKKTILEE